MTDALAACSPPRAHANALELVQVLPVCHEASVACKPSLSEADAHAACRHSLRNARQMPMHLAQACNIYHVAGAHIALESQIITPPYVLCFRAAQEKQAHRRACTGERLAAQQSRVSTVWQPAPPAAQSGARAARCGCPAARRRAAGAGRPPGRASASPCSAPTRSGAPRALPRRPASPAPGAGSWGSCHRPQSRCLAPRRRGLRRRSCRLRCRRRRCRCRSVPLRRFHLLCYHRESRCQRQQSG